MRTDTMIRSFKVFCNFIRHSANALILLTACVQLPAGQLQQMVIKDGCSKYQDPKTIEPLKKIKHPALEKGCVACHLDCNQLPSGDQPESPAYYLKTKEPVLCLECHNTSVKDMKDLSPAHDNQPLGNYKCTGCHDPHSGNSRLRIPEFSHGPYKARLCSACHPAPVNDKIQLAAANVNLLCTECHAQFKEEMEGTQSRHRLLSQSDRACVECHDPHAASQEYVLKKPVQDLCLGCHVEPPNKAASDNRDRPAPSQEAANTSKRSDDRNAQYLKLSSKYVHEPVTKSCVLCHDAHASEFPNELRAPAYDLCMDCHGKNAEKILNSSQPFPLFNGLVSLPPKTFEKLRHLELSDKFVHEPVNVSCTFCHDAHASDYPTELHAPVQDVCLACHGSNAERIVRSEQPIPLLGGRVILPPKAFKAMTGLNLSKFGHPTSGHPVYAPATAEKPELTCVSCHASHSTSASPKLLVAQKQALCSRCHEY
jgi:predicted CXXCH cytochrome family protein